MIGIIQNVWLFVEVKWRQLNARPLLFFVLIVGMQVGVQVKLLKHARIIQFLIYLNHALILLFKAKT